MDEAWWWLMDVVGPVILLVLLAWLAFRGWRRSPGDTERAERGTHRLYEEEETRRREGTDDL